LKVPDEVRTKYPVVPWREIAGMRNKLVHDYFGINMEVVWQTIHEDLPMLAASIWEVLKHQNK